MQIRAVVLYHRDRKRMREVKFVPGALNIIPGVSDTGKSALLEIIDYCLGSGKHRVSKEEQLESIGWYGLRLDIAGKQIFVGRERPEFGQKTSERAMLRIGAMAAPDPNEIEQTTNVKTIIRQLGAMIGIGENAEISPSRSTENPISATLRHAVPYVFQRQRLIADPRYLFAGQDEDKRMHIRDTLPYFLGAVDSDSLRQRRELRRRQRELKNVTSRLGDVESPQAEVMKRTDLLIQDASEMGLIDSKVEVAPNEARSVLKSALKGSVNDPGLAMTGDAASIAELQARKAELGEQLRDMRISRRTLLDRQRLARDYDVETQEHQARLRSLELLPRDVDGQPTCPLCGANESDHTPQMADLRHELERAASQASNSATAPPELEAAIESFDQQIETIRKNLEAVDRELAIVVERGRLSRQARGNLEQQFYLRGRIAGFLDEHPAVDAKEVGDLRQQVDGFTVEVEALEDALSSEATRTTADNALTYVSEYMTEMAGLLDLSYADGVRLDPVELTVVGRDPRGPVRLDHDDIGSGKSWVGYHVVTLLALHRYFVQQDRPVPRVLLFDQPTQAFYPSEKRQQGDRNISDLADHDQEQVHRIFNLIRETVDGLDGKLQVIVLDHAEIGEEWFSGAVNENNWRHGQALVPRDWY